MAGFTHYKYYNFTNKDPIIDEMRTKFQDTALSYKDATEGGVSETTIRNWFHGKTRRPQNATTEAFLRGIGFKRVIVALGKEDPGKKFATVKAIPLPHHKKTVAG